MSEEKIELVGEDTQTKVQAQAQTEIVTESTSTPTNVAVANTTTTAPTKTKKVTVEKVLTEEEIKKKKYEEFVPYFTKFINLLGEIIEGYKEVKSVESDQVNKRFTAFKGFYEIAKADDDVDDFWNMIYRSYLDVKISIREDKEVKGEWLGKELPNLKLDISVKKGKQPPIIMLTSIYNRANELREYREKQINVGLATKIDKSEIEGMIDTLRKEFPDLDYVYKFYLYLLYLYRLVLKEKSDLNTIEERINTLEIMLDIKDGSNGSGLSANSGILSIATKFAKQAGFDIPTDKIPTEKLEKTFDNILNSKALTNMFGNVAKNMKGQSFEKAIGGAMETLAKPESINAIKESHKEMMGDTYNPENEPEVDTAAISTFAKGFAKITSDMAKLAPKKETSSSSSSSSSVNK